MCGIAVCVCSAKVSDTVLRSTEWLQLLVNNTRRGPELQHQEDFDVQVQPNSTLHLSFFVSTLHLRGPEPVVQPHVSDNTVFCWNGEVFDGIEVSLEQNDGSILFSALESSRNTDDIYHLLSQVEGPYAFVYYQRKHRRLYFGRDPLGRRSLLLHYPTEKHPFFSLSSVSIGPGYGCTFEELDSKYIYSIDLSQSSSMDRLSPEIMINRRVRNIQPGLPNFAAILPVNNNIPEEPTLPNLNSDMGPLREDLTNAVDRLFNVLDKSVDEQVRNIPPPPTYDGSRVAVLFSGGIDSTIIAFLADRHIPSSEPIDLLNVAFENPRRLRSNTSRNSKEGPSRNGEDAPVTGPSNNDIMYDVPDRLSGLEELGELRRLCPNRRWNFVEINVTYAESSHAKEVVQSIMYPSKTVMDLSLALALYFLSKASGILRNSKYPTINYDSSAKVLLNGLGSDELLGGYARHLSVFKTMGWSGLTDELQLELDRIPARNLGRDDRIISHHGKESRHPFLSLTVVNTISQMPVHLKTDPRLGAGIGDKMLLRLLAKKLGLKMASARKKRAMQFGTSSARLEADIGGGDGAKSLYEER